jgi:hypothetical protein
MLNDYRTQSKWKWLALLAPVFLSLAIMTPRLISPQFGLFDDPKSLTIWKQMNQGDWNWFSELSRGRFRPFYWLFFALVYRLAGENPFWFYLVNTLLFVFTTASISYLVLHKTKKHLIAAAAGTLFALSGPIAESYYTLSKGEPLQLSVLLLSLVLIVKYPSTRTRLGKIGTVFACTIAIFLAMVSKETSLAILPIALGWMVLGWLRAIFGIRPVDLSTRYAYTISAAISSALWVGIRMMYSQGSVFGWGYTSRYVISIEQMLRTARQWEEWLNRDFLFLLPLTIIPLLVLLQRKNFAHLDLAFDSSVWIIGWIVVFLPWAWTVEYFLLPFSAGMSVFAAILFYANLQTAHEDAKFLRVVAGISLIAALAFLLLTLPAFIANARLQLTVDKANAELMDYLAEHTQRNSMVLINIQEPNQYVADIETYLTNVRGRPDLRFDHVRFQKLDGLPGPNGALYIASPTLDNQFYPSVRMGIQEHTSKQWNRSLDEQYGDDLEQVFESTHTLKLFIVDIRLTCIFLKDNPYCTAENIPLDQRVLSYGWRVEKLPVQE